jgi:hypothetical protein
MKLRELEARFLRVADSNTYQQVDALADADGLWLLCPKCFEENKGRVGTHGVICWFRGKVPDDKTPGPGRWTPSGTDIDNLTFVPGEPPMQTSVQLTEGCAWHGHIVNGETAPA